MAEPFDLTIVKGKTFEVGFCYASDELQYLEIEAMPKKAPVRLTLTQHNIPDGWPVRIECVSQPKELNTADDAPYFVRVIDADTIEINSLNGHCWKPLSGGGLVIFNKPVDITGWEFRAQFKDKIGGTTLVKFSSDPADAPDCMAFVDPSLSLFSLKMSAEKTALIDWKKAVYDAEAVTPAGEVYQVAGLSAVTIVDEVTT